MKRALSILCMGILALVTLASPAQAAEKMTPIKAYESQNLVWKKCYGQFQCSHFMVPIDYSNLSKGKFVLQLLKLSAKNQSKKLGSLVINPGGPGASGIDYAFNAQYVFNPEILKSYDIVGFDPRGVGRSQPIRCLTNKETDESYASNSRPTTKNQLTTLINQLRSYVKKCTTRNAHILDYSTSNSARDMDLLRSALGEKKLNFMGVSYGTYLGTLYAQYFPENVGRIVLDGAIDPNATGTEQNLTQAIGFDTALKAFVDDCFLKSDCPLQKPRSKALSQIISLFQGAATKPLRGYPNRPATESLLVLGTASALYDSATGWPQLRDAIREALSGTGKRFLDLSDDYTQRDLDGTYANNETDASFVIDCLDWQGAKSTTEISSSSKLFAKEAPVFGPYLAYAGLSCQFFPALSTIRQPIKLIKTTPIVIIGTTRDPATPYVWAQALHKAIANSSLISLNGDGHTGYGHGSTCVDSAVDAYFLYGKVPKKELLCTTSFNE